MSVELADLRAFLAVADELSFARAAERLHVAQPALSRRIARLEHELGFALFHRTTRRVSLTAAGAVFVDEAGDALDRVERAIDVGRRAAAGRVGEIRIGYNDFAISGSLPEIVHGWRGAEPGVEVRLARAATDVQLQRLELGELDVAFVVAPVRGEGVEQRVVRRDRLVAVLPERHRLAERPTVRLDELAAEPHVFGDARRWRAYRRLLQPLYTRAGGFPTVAAEGPDASAVLGLVAAGLGVTVYPECVASAVRRGIVTRPLDAVSETVDTVMVWRSRGTSPVAARFVAFAGSFPREPNASATRVRAPAPVPAAEPVR